MEEEKKGLGDLTLGRHQSNNSNSAYEGDDYMDYEGQDEHYSSPIQARSGI